MPSKLNARAAAAHLSWQIIDGGVSLDNALQSYFENSDPKDRGLIQELVYGVCRWYGELDAIAARLLQRPIKRKDRVIHYVLLVGIYQLSHLQTAQHAAVSETVNASRQLGRQWAGSMINGCLRRWLRESESLRVVQHERNRLTHPKWLLDAIDTHWPQFSEQILEANNQRPPMILRVNQRLMTRDEYLLELSSSGFEASADPRSRDAICLAQPAPVVELPGFSEGWVSVQDIAAQIAADILSPDAGDCVLDACAAPGGKAAHIQERSNNELRLDALDISETRVERLRDTFQRLQLHANILCADAQSTSSWEQPEGGYDHIVIDAPCSGTGVIRRHPDIRHHRQPADIENLCETQRQLLENLWPLLKPNGQLLYLTCSILPAENNDQVERFLQATPTAELKTHHHPQALQVTNGHQTLPGVHNMDGFFYALMRKIE
jgi:16S rRNA (cytosine967-C5)-methyltransferase